MAMIVPVSPITVAEREIAMLVAVAANSSAHLSYIEKVACWEQEDNFVERLQSATSATVFSAINGKGWKDESSAAVVREFVIHNPNGMHARPGKVFVSTLKSFKASVEVRNAGQANEFVNGKSLIKLLGLGITKGTTIEVRATGSDASQALDALTSAIESGLGE